ncbi:MAG: hypothetical protein EBR82_49290 [Caulobacteraceae bacterium]|nr:hypothetical protein [Caulobacteraceae bacterium]
MKLTTVINKLNKTRDKAIELVGKTIALAADAGRIITNAKTEGKDVQELCREAGITEEVARRYEKVAATQKPIINGDTDPSLMRQTYLRIGMLPDPITVSKPSEPKHFLFPIMKARQWLAARGAKFISQDKTLREQFLAEAEPIVRTYEDLKHVDGKESIA